VCVVEIDGGEVVLLLDFGLGAYIGDGIGELSGGISAVYENYMYEPHIRPNTSD
jgi:hypothetical protein